MSHKRGSPLNIAVIADTHNRWPEGLPDALAGADEIWHLGDVGHPAFLDPLLAFGCPLVVVEGNTDVPGHWPLHRRLTRNDWRFHLVHIPPSRPPPETDYLLHGHTHVPRQEEVGTTWFLNPGCLTRPNRGAPRSFAWLRLVPGQRPDWDLVVCPS